MFLPQLVVIVPPLGGTECGPAVRSVGIRDDDRLQVVVPVARTTLLKALAVCWIAHDLIDEIGELLPRGDLRVLFVANDVLVEGVASSNPPGLWVDGGVAGGWLVAGGIRVVEGFPAAGAAVGGDDDLIAVVGRRRVIGRSGVAAESGVDGASVRGRWLRVGASICREQASNLLQRRGRRSVSLAVSSLGECKKGVGDSSRLVWAELDRISLSCHRLELN
jgi:hypothetical protein